MEIKETLYVHDRAKWRSWLAENHAIADEIWLIYYKVNSNKPRIPYNDAVEEALCYGWIDSTVKRLDDERFVQRFSPRRKNSQLSELNRERIRRLIENGRMTSVGLEKVRHHLEGDSKKRKGDVSFKEYKLPDDILDTLKKDPVIWKNFRAFPESYKRIRIGWIDSARERPEIFQTRLRYFIKMTGKNKMFGMVR